MQANPVVDKLNMLLRGEISAVETYRQALESLKDPSCREQVSRNERSHEQRVDVLRSRIRELGGTPSSGSGTWGALSKAVTGTSKVGGDKGIINALEQGEDIGLSDYQKNIDGLDPDTRSFIQSTLLPQQQHTHETMSALKHMQA